MSPPGRPTGEGRSARRDAAPVPFQAVAPGSLVAVLAPAGPAPPGQLAAVHALYARHGLRARLFDSCHASSGYLAGSDALRLADLHAALADDAVAAIHCLRGGYGSMRLLDGIDTALLRRKPKLLIGYSDITALHALWCSQGLPSLHAPMPASDLVQPGRGDDEDALFTLLQRGLPAGAVLAPALDAGSATAGLRVAGRAEGRLIGGNLSLVAALLGTPWAWRADAAGGAILFLEDINEALYRIDRLLTQLRLAGVLGAVAGIVLGSFNGAASPLPLLQQLLLPLCRQHGKPLLGGWPSGHGTPNRPLPLGVRVALQVDAGGGRIELLDDFIRAK